MSNRRAAAWYAVYFVIAFCVAGPVAYHPDPTLYVQPLTAFLGPVLLAAFVAFFPWAFHLNRASERKAKRELDAVRGVQPYKKEAVPAGWGKGQTGS